MKFHNILSVATAISFVACGQAANSPELAKSKQGAETPAIIGGFPSGGPSLQGVGTVGIMGDASTGDEGAFYMICTATLIDQNTVLTAKHCTIDTEGDMTPVLNSKMVNWYKMGFAIGNANTPDRVVEVIASEVANPWQGGFMGLGNDVGIYHLASPITDVAPIAVTPTTLSDADVNQTFASIGYGVQDNLQGAGYADLDGTRKVGAQHLDALSGNFFQLIFGTQDAYLAWANETYGTDVVNDNLDIINGWWTDSPLLTGYEVMTGNRPGDVQTCFGDSGSPLMRSVNVNGVQTKEVYAVLSGGIGSLEKACDYGSVYSAMADTTRAFITQAETYVDPCAGGVTVAGSCDGDVATRCTGKYEGDRSLSTVDCSIFGQTCATGSDGKVGCFDIGTDPSVASTAPKAALKTPAQVQAGVQLRFSLKNRLKLNAAK